jgi:hypothetical protein
LARCAERRTFPHYAECHYVECLYDGEVVMLSIVASKFMLTLMLMRPYPTNDEKNCVRGFLDTNTVK